MQCSNARSLSSDLRSSQRSELQQFRIIAHRTRRVISWFPLIFSPVLGVKPEHVDQNGT